MFAFFNQINQYDYLPVQVRDNSEQLRTLSPSADEVSNTVYNVYLLLTTYCRFHHV